MCLTVPGHEVPLYTRCRRLQPKPVSKHTCLVAAFSSNSVNLRISQAAVSHEAQFQHAGTVSPGRDSSVHARVVRVVWRDLVTALEGKNVLNQTV